MNDFLNRYDRIQRLTKPLAKTAERHYRPWMFGVIGFGLLLIYVWVNLASYDKPIRNNCITCHNAQTNKLHGYFKERKAPNPEALAIACLSTNSPRLLAAITKKEGMKIESRKGGYKGRHQGAWQVNPKYWGKVSTDPVEQAKQVEGILIDLIDEQKDIESALNYYGGDTTQKKYANDVLVELQNVPHLN